MNAYVAGALPFSEAGRLYQASSPRPAVRKADERLRAARRQ